MGDFTPWMKFCYSITTMQIQVWHREILARKL